MGGSSSKNVASATMEAISEVVTNIMNKSISRTGQSIILTFKTENGNIRLSKNKIIQQATVNTSNLLSALSTSTVQQEMVQKISQVATSLSKGLNLGNISDASNTLNAYMKAAISISTNISQICKNSIGQSVVINLTTKNGNIIMDGNTIHQVASIFSNCIQDTIADNAAIQKLQQQLDQSASATSEGLNLDWLLGIVAAVVVLIIVVIITGAKVASGILTKLLMFVGFIIIAAGIVLIVIYFKNSKTDIDVTGFSTGYSNNSDCKAQVWKNMTYDDSILAGQACLEEDQCDGYDWLPSKNTIFYKSIGNKKCRIQDEKPPNPPYVRKPNAFVGDGPPKNDSEGRDGDIYIDRSTSGFGNYYIKVRDKWNPEITGNIFVEVGVPSTSSKHIIVVHGNNPPFADVVNTQSYVVQDSVDYASISLYLSDGLQYSLLGKLNVTPNPTVPPNNQIPWSGSKYVIRDKKLLYIGIGLIVLGVVTTIVQVVVMRRDAKKKAEGKKSGKSSKGKKNKK